MSQPPVIDAAALHALSNHLSIILGFVELVIVDTPEVDPHRQDLLEIREAAVRAASLIGHPMDVA